MIDGMSMATTVWRVYFIIFVYNIWAGVVQKSSTSSIGLYVFHIGLRSTSEHFQALVMKLS